MRRTGIWVMVAFVAAYVVVGVVLDGGKISAHDIPALVRPWLLPVLLVMAPMNYLLRFVKWQMYTVRLGFRHVPWRANLVIFLAGLGLTVTPGKFGELIKSWLLWDRYRVPAASSAPMVVADRLTDGCAMLVLATVGVVLLGRGKAPYSLIAAIVVLIALLRSRRVMLWVLRLLARLPRLGALEHKMHELLDAGQALLEVDIFGYALGLGLVGWGMEGLIVFLALAAFGWKISIAASLLVVASSAIAGGISALPGGVGAAEGVMIGLLLWLNVPLPLAVLTMLITRFSTLWLGVTIGLIALGAVQARDGSPRKAATGPAPS